LTKYEKRHGKTTGARMNGREMMIVRLEHDDGTMSDDRQAGQGRSHTDTHTGTFGVERGSDGITAEK
jgi:hypothetical protein